MTLAETLRRMRAQRDHQSVGNNVKEGNSVHQVLFTEMHTDSLFTWLQDVALSTHSLCRCIHLHLDVYRHEEREVGGTMDREGRRDGEKKRDIISVSNLPLPSD